MTHSQRAKAARRAINQHETTHAQVQTHPFRSTHTLHTAKEETLVATHLPIKHRAAGGGGRRRSVRASNLYTLSIALALLIVACECQQQQQTRPLQQVVPIAQQLRARVVPQQQDDRTSSVARPQAMASRQLQQQHTMPARDKAAERQDQHEPPDEAESSAATAAATAAAAATTTQTDRDNVNIDAGFTSRASDDSDSNTSDSNDSNDSNAHKKEGEKKLVNANSNAKRKVVDAQESTQTASSSSSKEAHKEVDNQKAKRQLTAPQAATANKLSGHLRFEFQRYDGWYNNLANADWGTLNSRLRRKVAPAYADGVYQMNDEGRPSARLLSQRMMRGEDGLASRRNLTTIFAFFGQVISSEILMASESGCPIEMHRIKIERCDPMYDRGCRGDRTMPFYRAAYDQTTGQSPNLPREQINRVTSWIDGSFIYSTSETWLNTMRSFDGKGTLKMVGSPGAHNAVSATSNNNQQQQQQPTADAAKPFDLGSLFSLDTLVALSNALTGASPQPQAASASSQTPPGADARLAASHERLMAAAARSGAPMSQFGFPVRNRKRAPLINQIPAHHLKMKTAERMFLLGDPRTNQNPVILSFGILFYRWHNVLAERIHVQHPDWSDEEIFQRARRLVIASLQNIILYEYLPALLDTPPPPSSTRRRASFDNTTTTTTTTMSLQTSNTAGSELEYDERDIVRPYTGYKPDLHPGISHVFQSAAFRFGHTMIPPGLYLRDDKCRFLDTPQGHKGVRLCSTWWNAEEVVSRVGIEQLLMGAASQVAEREDYVLCNDVRDKLFGPLDFSRRDLAALNIMRGRDNGLADYNTVRQAFRLPKITRWQDINPVLHAREPKLFAELAAMYNGEIDKLDVYIGGMLESDLERGRPGVLFRRIIKEQFERLRDADRFWFENLESGVFNEAEIDEIRRITLYDIIVNATIIPDRAIQRDVFRFKPSDPCPQPGQLSSSQLQQCYIVQGHSYFKGSELTYALVCITLVLIPIACWLVASAVVNWQDRKRRQLKAQQEYLRSVKAAGNSAAAAAASSQTKRTGDSSKFYAKEWLHSNLKRRIKIKFGSKTTGDSMQQMYILDRKCQVQRKLELSHGASVVVEISTNRDQTGNGAYLGPVVHPLHAPQTGGANAQPHALAALELDAPLDHKPMVLIRAERNYDLVLQFADVAHRRKFVHKLHAYLAQINKSVSMYRVARDVMLANAETKEKRQQRLEQFFREAYALTFGLGASNNSSSSTTTATTAAVSSDVGLVMRTSLSRNEFAEALGMRSDSLFVRQMFNCIDKDGNGRISFQEFLDTVVLFSRGKPDDKLRIVFDMCDHSRRGVIEKTDLVRIIRSLIDIAKTKSLTESGIMHTIDEMFRAVGLQDKPLLTYDDFKLIISSGADITTTTTVASQQQQQQNEAKFNTFNNQQILAIGLDMKGAKKNFFVDTSAACALASAPPTLPHHDDDAAGSRERKMTVVETGAQQAAIARQLSRAGWNADSSAAAESTHANKHAHKAKGLVRALTERWRSFITELEEHRQDIVYLLMFYVCVVVLFLERFVNYSFLSEHMDLRHVMGVGIAITRGSAASLSFCFSMLLLSMCRNIQTWIRTTAIREYIPLDSHVRFHKIVAYTALVMTVLHSVGHCVNFYHVTQQPVEHLRCLTKEMQFSGESRPTFFYWIFQTVTGLTGLLLWAFCSILYVFAHERVRLRAYSYFWNTHKLYYVIYMLTLMHGSSKLTGSPRFWIFFMVPAVLFTIDKIISLQTKLLQLEIFDTELLPSDVIALKFARPPSFKFLSGQWIRVACTAFRTHEFHAFTLTSAPQDDYLSIHVRAQGPWTWKLRSMFDPSNALYNGCTGTSGINLDSDSNESGDDDDDDDARTNQQQVRVRKTNKPFRQPPRLRIEGPFGGGNQDWYKYEVAIMIGGGIGVTPYASILNDLVFGTSTRRYSSVNYKKVYFVWICPTHRNFEWFIDVLRDVESKDVTNLLEMHIFITQFFHKFDLRTTMLYICENHFQRISNRSLFTGLKAINHFGRPDIAALLEHVQAQHSQVSKVGVFSCGPTSMTKSITSACEKVNKRRKLPFFVHQYENFS